MGGESIYTTHPSVYEALLRHTRDPETTVTDHILPSLDDFNLPTDARILDVGCGTGIHLDSFPETYTRIGVDISTEILSYGKEIMDYDFTAVNGDFHTLPLQSSTVDAITCLYSTVNYVNSQDVLIDVMNEWERVLTDNGVIIIEFTPCPPEQMGTDAETTDEFVVPLDTGDVTVSQESRISGTKLEINTTYTIPKSDNASVQFVDEQQCTLLSADHVTNALNDAGLTTRIRDDLLPLHTVIASR